MDPEVTKIFRRMAKRLMGDNDTMAPQRPIPVRLALPKKRHAVSDGESPTKKQRDKMTPSNEFIIDSEDDDVTRVGTDAGTPGLYEAKTPNSCRSPAASDGPDPYGMFGGSFMKTPEHLRTIRIYSM